MIVGLDRSKQRSRGAIATLYRVGRACYPCFGPSGSWRTSLDKSGYSWVTSISRRIGMYFLLFWHRKCFSALEETISVKHKSRSWWEVWTHLWSEKGTVVSYGPFAILYHARSPRIKRCFYTYSNLLWVSGGALSRIIHFASQHVLQWLQGKR